MPTVTAVQTQSPEHKAASAASKKAMTAVVKNGVLTVTCPVIERESSTRKTIIIANGSKQMVYKDDVAKVSLNAYVYNPDYGEPQK